MQRQQGSVHSRSLAQSWLTLPAKTRLYLSLGVCFIGAVGIVVSHHLENKYPAKTQVEENKK